MRLTVPPYPLVSICIPAFNAEGTLARTIESALAQTYPNLEIIVSDNHSVDGTARVIQAFAQRGVRMCRPPRTAPAGQPGYIGAYVNSNFVLSQARGEIVCLYHADDLFEPEMVQAEVEQLLANPSLAAVFTMLRYINEKDQPATRGVLRLPEALRDQPVFNFERLLNAVMEYRNFIPTPSFCTRRAALDAVGPFAEGVFGTSSDLEMWLRIAQSGPILILDQPLLLYRITPHQYGAQYNRLRVDQADYFRVIEHFLTNPTTRAIVSPTSMQAYEMEKAADAVLRALHLAVLGETAQARALLAREVLWSRIGRGMKRPRWTRWMAVGLALRCALAAGLGQPAAQAIYQRQQRWQAAGVRSVE